MKTRCEFITEADNDLFNFRTIRPKFILTSFQHFLNSKLDRLSLQQFDFEMNSAGYPDKYNFFELGYCAHPQFPYSKIFIDQASDLILSHFQDEDRPFITEGEHNFLNSKLDRLSLQQFDFEMNSAGYPEHQ